MTKRNVLVTGATGQQGGSVIRALAAKGHNIRALVRSKDSAGDLAARGVELALGDYDDAASLAAALDGIDTLFAVTTPFAGGVETEIRQGKALVDAAVKAAVSHVVYSSVGDADKSTGIPHFDSKFGIEKALRASGLAWTITAPAYFYDNLVSPWTAPDLKNGVFGMALAPTKPLKQISVRDIGRFNAHVIDQREPFLGQRIDIAGDELTGPEMVAAVSAATGKTITYQEQPIEPIRAQNEDLALMMEWFDQGGYTADVDGLRRKYPEIGWQTFAEWAADHDWSAVFSAPEKEVA